jgi:hypothetical protein
MRKFAMISCAALLAAASFARFAQGHGYVGDRFFPATVTTDDPLVADELALPSLTLSYASGMEDSPPVRTIGAGFEFDKVIIPKLAIGVSDQYFWQRPDGGPTAHGWDNVTVTIKYEAWRSDAHEAIVSVGLESEIGGTGSLSVGRDSFSTFTPTVYFGKGFGDLPDGAAFLKPFAVTGTVGLSMPTEAADAHSIEWGLALQYNLLYLQQHVQDVGIPAPFKNMIPVVEFSMESPLNRGGTTGTVNPGVLWESRYFQVGVEALIPVNSESGNHVGAAVQIQIYIDDLLPDLFGHPIFGD